jgi:hypothetical protein
MKANLRAKFKDDNMEIGIWVIFHVGWIDHAFLGAR